jgi:hypothetical protein
VVSPLVRAADRGPSGGLARDRARRERAGLGPHGLRQDAGRLTFTGSIASWPSRPSRANQARIRLAAEGKSSATRPRPSRSRWYDSSASRVRIAERDGRRVRLTRQRRARCYAPTAGWRSSTSPRRRSPPSTGPGRHDRDRCVPGHRRPPSWSPRSPLAKRYPRLSLQNGMRASGAVAGGRSHRTMKRRTRGARSDARLRQRMQ